MSNQGWTILLDELKQRLVDWEDRVWIELGGLQFSINFEGR